jgi:hypothetical protein
MFKFHVKSYHTYSPTRRVYSAAGQEMKRITSLRIAAVCKRKGAAENEDGEESSSLQFAWHS